MAISTFLRSHRAATCPWAVDVLRQLDEHHLSAWSPSDNLRRNFSHALRGHLSALPAAEVVSLDGSRITSESSFAAALGAALGLPETIGSIDGRAGVCAALRSRDREPIAKRRFVLWQDAHIMLAAAPHDFGRAVDALLGTAAENEMVSEDLLLLQRVVFIGRPALDLYAEDPRGQFASWYSECGETPLWRIVTGMPSPRVRSARIESLLRGVAAA